MADLFDLMFPHLATTDDIRVRVAVNFLPEQSAPSAGRWFWSYHIRIENGGAEPVQLIERHWRIVDGRGDIQLVHGVGVVGETPTIAPGESFDYVSGCPLDTPGGEMSGHYSLVRGSGERFHVVIPAFALIPPGER